MSLITQCPACGTLFKVVADQLKISQGWVRCGQCREVFDASAQITTPQEIRVKAAAIQAQDATATQPDARAAAPQQKLQVGQPDSVQSPEVATKKVAAHAPSMLKNAAFLSDDWINSVNPPAPPVADDDDVVSSGFATSSAWAASGASTYDGLPELDSPPSVLPEDLLQEHEKAKSLSNIGAQTGTDGAQATAVPTASGMSVASALAPMPTPGFVRQAQRAARWRSPWVRAGLALVALTLLAGLAGQVVVQERARMIALFPQTQPWLRWLCVELACKIEALKQIESIVVDASAFNKLKSSSAQDAYRLNITLKNTANLPVALPHVELSLTDAQDASVLRRVLSPADLSATGQVLAARGDFAGGAAIQIDNTQLGGARISGYRVLAFYP